jgi:hypothetical protein
MQDMTFSELVFKLSSEPDFLNQVVFSGKVLLTDTTNSELLGIDKPIKMKINKDWGVTWSKHKRDHIYRAVLCPATNKKSVLKFYEESLKKLALEQGMCEKHFLICRSIKCVNTLFIILELMKSNELKMHNLPLIKFCNDIINENSKKHKELKNRFCAEELERLLFVLQSIQSGMNKK